MSTVAKAHDADLPARVGACEDLARTPGSEVYLDPAEVDYEAWNHVGDPLCEALMTLMRERRLMGGDIYANARTLRAEGCPEAIAFFADVETIPSWLDFEALRAGASVGKRNPIGMMFGIHSALPFTYIDPATAEVMGSTGRLARGGDFARRYWETATGFVGALDVDGMKPGGRRWEEWVRIRFLHTMIRMGILRSGRWTMDSMPISQMATAGATFIFGQHRVDIMELFGGVLTEEERNSFALMWRWVSRIEGAPNQLLGRTTAEEFELQSRIHQFIYGANPNSAALMAQVVDGTASMALFGRSRRLNHAVARRQLGPAMTRTVPGKDARELLDLPADPLVDGLLAASRYPLLALGYGARTRPIRALFDRRGQAFYDRLVARGLHGVKADYRGTPVAGRPTDQ
ncbi:MAG: oxygenase MpaB family protein [Nocardioides sp.]|uniref:oxygenase MpaB family protein n=1 Tax=Nocardioides sp. TaxID=35761 RepID=UPI0039E36B7D